MLTGMPQYWPVGVASKAILAVRTLSAKLNLQSSHWYSVMVSAALGRLNLKAFVLFFEFQGYIW
jgi:hypothetical protein